jgi:hypothetical protein
MTEAKKIDVSPKLYEAATESLVSDASAVSTFEKMITVGYSHSTVETFIKELKDTEKLIKKEFEVGSMPGPWRSSKSVITSAMKLGIGLCDSNGTFYGKTYLQNKIKDSKTDSKELVTLDEYISKVCALIGNVPDHLDAKVVSEEVHKYLMGV